MLTIKSFGFGFGFGIGFGYIDNKITLYLLSTNMIKRYNFILKK